MERASNGNMMLHNSRKSRPRKLAKMAGQKVKSLVFDDYHTDRELRQNFEKRMDVAVDLLEDHPYTRNVSAFYPAREVNADFTSGNPDTDALEMMLGLERWSTVLANDDDGEAILAVGWDLNEEYHVLEKDGEEHPFEAWSDDYEWPHVEYEESILHILARAGWRR